jgi:hypothetical protein
MIKRVVAVITIYFKVLTFALCGGVEKNNLALQLR